MADGVLAAVLGVVMVGPYYGSIDRPTGPEDAPAWALVGLVTATLLVRRLFPLVALGGVVAAVATYLALGLPDGPILLAVPIMTYTVGAHLAVRRSLPACVVGAAVLTAVEVPDPSGWAALTAPATEWLLICGLAPWAIGAILRMEREAARAARAQARRDRAHRERLQTAHDVHDIVGHGLAAISMQAGVALHVLDRSPERARQLLAAVQQSSRDALDELRSTLALFGSTDDGRAAAPRLDQLDALVERTAEAGLPVELVRTGAPGPLPAGVELTAYRIVQEALTNALRHAGPAVAAVRIGHGADELTVEVSDTGRGPGGGPGPAGSGGGLGIVGMRTRAEALGGTLAAGPAPGGGFTVRARLPVRRRP